MWNSVEFAGQQMAAISELDGELLLATCEQPAENERRAHSVCHLLEWLRLVSSSCGRTESWLARSLVRSLAQPAGVGPVACSAVAHLWCLNEHDKAEP